MGQFPSNVCIIMSTRRLPARDPPWLHESIICFDLPSIWVLKRAPTFISVQYAFAFISENRENIMVLLRPLKLPRNIISASVNVEDPPAVANKYTHHITGPDPWKTKEHQPHHPAATHTAADDRQERAPDLVLKFFAQWEPPYIE